MGGMYGADVEQLRALARAFDCAAAKLDSDRASVGNAIRIEAWIGPIAVRFRAEWDSAHSVRLAGAAARLHAAAAALNRNVDEQERTSAAGGPSPITAAAESTLGRKWSAMSAAERAALPDSKLAVYGYTDAVPASVRDQANRLVLERYLADTTAPEYDRKAVAYQQILSTLRSHPDAQLLLLDPQSGRQVHAAIALGDVETAGHIGIYTQGWTSRTDGPGGILDPIADLARLRARVDGDDHAPGDHPTPSAMVMWMGYDSPQDDGVLPVDPTHGIANAQMRPYGEAGSRALAEFAEGVRRFNPHAHITGVGHSYGSFVTGLAAQQTSAFNDVVVIGSPGVGAQRASDLKLDGRLFVIEHRSDVVADIAQFGADPSRMVGAHVMHTGTYFHNVGAAHTAYLADGSASQQRIASVIGGREP